MANGPSGPRRNVRHDCRRCHDLVRFESVQVRAHETTARRADSRSPGDGAFARAELTPAPAALDLSCEFAAKEKSRPRRRDVRDRAGCQERRSQERAISRRRELRIGTAASASTRAPSAPRDAPDRSRAAASGARISSQPTLLELARRSCLARTWTDSRSRSKPHAPHGPPETRNRSPVRGASRVRSWARVGESLRDGGVVRQIGDG
jgi:hypothetical protein